MEVERDFAGRHVVHLVDEDPYFECVDLCSVDFQSEQPARLLQVDVIWSDCDWYLGGADLKRFKQSPVF